MFCKDCGRAFDEGAVFCGGCGAAAKDDAPAATANHHAPQAAALPEGNGAMPKKGGRGGKAKIAIFAAAGLLLAGAAAVFVIFFMGNNDFEPPYEVISFGRYEEIGYIGEGRFLTSRGHWPNISWGIQNYRGEEIIPFGRYNWPDTGFTTTDGNFLVQDGRTFLVLDAEGNELLTIGGYDWVRYVSMDRFVVSRNGQSALIDAENNYIIPMGAFGFGSISPSFDGLWLTIWDGNSVGILDINGNEIVPFGSFDNAHPISNGRFFVSRGHWP